MKHFNNIETLEDLKKQYKKLAFANHPDRGGNVEVMKAINSEYDELFAKYKDVHKNKDGKTYTKENTETVNEFKGIIEKLIKLHGIDIEIIGCFIWVSGETKPHKDAFKKMGFRWHSSKKCWYKSPAGYRKKSKKSYSMEEVRDMFGARASYSTENENAIATA